MHQESELKFIGDEAALSALRQSAPFLGFAGHRNATTVTRRAVYFDTADHALRRAGYVLRVRGEGNVQCQTLKRIGSGELVTRPEFKSEISGTQPETASIPDSRTRWKITHLLAGRPLEPIFEVDTRRTLVLLTPARNVEVEAAIDTGEIRLAKDAQRALTISEVEFELMRGSMNDLLSTARLLTRGLPLTLSFLSKPERGFRLAADEALAPWRPSRINLRSAQTADDAVAGIISNCLRHLLNNHDAVMVGHNPEGIHQMRVALRRLRVAFSLLSREHRAPLAALLDQVKQVASVLGACRDQEILLTDMTLPVARQLGREGEFVPLVRRMEQARDETWAGAIECLASENFRTLVLDLATVTQQRPWLSNPSSHRDLEGDVRRFAARQVSRRLVQCRKSLRRARKLRAAELHELRIGLKKLRYTLEFFAGVDDDHGSKALLKRVSRLQDVLGEMNDVLVAREQLRTMIADSRAGDAASSVSLAGGMLLGWHGRRYVSKRRRVRARLKSLAGSKRIRKAG
jgi:inorganic triphosphatase YgiF